MLSSRRVAFVEVVCHLAERSIPLLAEASGERTFEEFVYGQPEFATLLHGVLEHVPAVVVERHGAVGEALLADRVECAGDGLDEAGLAGAVCTLKGAEAAVAFVAGEDAVLAAHDACHEVAVAVERLC